MIFIFPLELILLSEYGLSNRENTMFSAGSKQQTERIHELSLKTSDLKAQLLLESEANMIAVHFITAVLFNMI